ncbi:MAG TPA: fused MFS/spermidine synthase [Candidatus Binatia bacterium]
MDRRRSQFAVLGACLCASGAAALIYEVLWLREISLVMGHTVYALAAILTAFLGGLTLGAALGGRWTERYGASLGLYAALELAIAVLALLLPLLTHALSPLVGVLYREIGGAFAAYSLAQFLLCGVVVLLPTVFMGATLPIVTQIVLRARRDIAAGAGTLYALNSIGGALGAAGAGFVLLPALGSFRAGLVAAALNATAAAAALWLGRRRAAAGAAPDDAGPACQDGTLDAAADDVTVGGEDATAAWPTPSLRALTILYALFGFANLALEVGWARLVTLSIGSTTQGFTITLVTYIAGLAAGSFVVPRLALLRRRPVEAIVALHAVIALWTLGSLAYLGDLPDRVGRLLHVPGGRGFGAVLWAETLLVGATIALPTIAMGGVFPLVAALLRRSVRSSGRAVGAGYAANSIGNIVGSFVAGFVLVPTIGMRGAIVLSALLTSAIAVGYLVPALRRGRPLPALAALALVGTTALLAQRAPGWSAQRITSGPYFHAQDLGTLIDYREGASAIVAVKQIGGQRTMQVGGIREATSGSSLPNYLGHLAMLLHGPARSALVVGLGSGTTLASVLAHPVEHVDCVEISREVIDVAREYFAEFVGAPLADPRVHMILGDGRNHLRHDDERYDVIVSQPSYPWVSGAGGLFTREYFADVRAHLAPGGLAVAWFTAESEAGRRSIIRAWSEVFANAFLFESKNVDSLLVGLADPGRLSAANVVAGFHIAAVERDLGKLGVADPESVLGSLVAGPETLRAYAVGVPSNTDDNGYVEFRGLRDFVSESAGPRATITRDDPARYVDPRLGSDEETQAFMRRLAAVYTAKR